jgi:Uma2 family endonuclease
MHAEIELEQRLLSAEEFHAMGTAGIFDEDDRLELIDGRIIPMTPIGGWHMQRVNELTRLFVGRTPLEVTVSVQNPVRLGTYQEPQPDVVLIRPGAPRDRIPAAADVLLIVEVADTTLARDRGVKLPRYAAAGVPEVWIVSLADDTLEVYRRPGAAGYEESRRLRRGGVVDVEALPAFGEVAVDEVLGAPADGEEEGGGPG